MTDDEWQALFENFETQWLLDAIGDIDTLRSHLNEDKRYQPPKIRDKLFTLHQLAMAVVNEGSRSKVDELFDLATELEDTVFEMMEALTRLQNTLTKLTDLRPATSA
jgi:uncharacterized protein (UPF0305 family)